MSLMIMSRDELVRFSGDAPIHTDDNSLLEFSAPKYIYRDDRETLVRQLTPFIQIDPGLVRFRDTDPELSVRVLGDIVSAKRSESQIAEIEKKARVERLLEDANETFNRGNATGALKLYEEVLLNDPENILTYLNMGNVLSALNRFDEAEAAFVRTLVINPYYIFGAEALARLHLSAGRIGEAASLMESIHRWYSGDATTHQILGLAYALDKKSNRAVQEWQQSVRLNPEQEEAHYYLGLQLQKVHPRQAKEHLQKFLALARQKNPDDSRIGKAEGLLKKL
jgi:spermidine synthase